MTASTESVLESATLAQVFTDKGFNILKDSIACNHSPEVALTRIAVSTIQRIVKRGKTREICLSGERIEQIVEPLMNKADVRRRLRDAGYRSVKIRFEAEFSYMEAV